MSRIGKKLITIPQGVTVQQENGAIVVTGPKGKLSQAVDAYITLAPVEGGAKITIADPSDLFQSAMWGTIASIVHGMIEGVTTGFKRQMEVNGVGYKVALKGKNLELLVGLSHPVIFPIPEGITITVDANVITIEGISKQLVGETAARLRRIKKPEPYQGKGIKYMEEVLRRKAGKTAAA